MIPPDPITSVSSQLYIIKPVVVCLSSLTPRPIDNEDLLPNFPSPNSFHYPSFQYQQAFHVNTQVEWVREIGRLIEDHYHSLFSSKPNPQVPTPPLPPFHPSLSLKQYTYWRLPSSSTHIFCRSHKPFCLTSVSLLIAFSQHWIPAGTPC